MIKNRQIVVGLATIGVVFAVYLLYNLLSDTPKINPNQTNGRSENIEIPQFDSESAKIGDVTAGPVGKSRFIDRNKKTKEVERIFGYGQLLNPEQGSKKWQLEKPYMDIYKQAANSGSSVLSCQIVSDRGTAQMETVGGKPSPTDAHLIGNVIIKIHPTDKTNPTEAMIYLDDLVYNSQRSEFTTTGPVKIVSNRGQMEGRGLVLIYNTGLGRLEYLRIVDLDYIHYKRLSQISSQADISKSQELEAAVATDAIEPVVLPLSADSVSSDAAIEPNDVVTKTVETKTPQLADADSDDTEEKKNYYQCRFIENARIEYGNKIVIDSADEIVINNILWSETAIEKPETSTNQTATAAATTSSAKQPTEAVEVESELVKPKLPQPTVSTAVNNVVSLKPLGRVEDGSKNTTGAADVVDVFIRCNGGMIIQPTAAAGLMDNSQVIEVAGRPVRVRQADQADDLAQCAMMRYNVDSDILSMFTSDKERYNRLRIAESDSTLRTTGTITWHRRANLAKIDGPGIILFGAETKDDVAEMTFGSVMNLFFAKSPVTAADKLILKSADLAGGMTATMSRGSESRAIAESATFLFDQQSNISVANLNGNVQFTSDDGRLTSQRAKILFAKNSAGKAYAKTLQSSERAVLERTTSSSVAAGDNTKPARLEASRIDYDISTGNAVATGPVKFKFYMPEDESAGHDARPIPVVITAKKDATYFSAQNRVVFSGDVVGTSQSKKDGYEQTNRFYGEKLIVDLAETEAKTETSSGRMDISHLTVTDGNVRLESRRIANGVKISHVGLSCERIDYDASEKLLVATGPGEIQLNNANMPTTKNMKRNKKPGYYNGPSYALVRNFDTLKWFTDMDRIIADGKAKTIYMSYIPVLANGKLGKKDEASVTHMVADFIEKETKQKELLNLVATEGIYYKQGKKGNWFLGDKLFYDAESSLMTVYGSDRWPCMINGAKADNVEYNLLTGRKKLNLSQTPGAVGF